jgi:hypothetical protein
MRYVGVAVLFAGVIMSVSWCAEAWEPSKWDRVQTYGMLPIDPEKAAERGWTVNGLWAGFGMPEAVRSATHATTEGTTYPVEWSYATMKDYVEAHHNLGLKVPATLMGIAGHPLLRKRFPEMEQASCVGSDGKRAYWDPGSGDSYFMCSINPAYREVLLTIGKEAIDADVDLIVIDEVQGNEFCFHWSNEPGFCDYCLDAYRTHLGTAFNSAELKAKFGIEVLDEVDFAGRLAGQRAKPWADRTPLFRELWLLQERLNFESRTKLVDGLRGFMKARGRMIPICGNTPGAGLGDYDGYRISSVKYAQLLDFIAFENSRDEPLPQGKWVANERIAAAAFRLPSAVETNYGPLGEMQLAFAAGKGSCSTMFAALLAEANANGCHFVNYFQTRWSPNTEGLWEGTFRGQKFILEHRDLFEAEADSGASVGILYLENKGQRYRTRSFMGMVQALSESSIPYDVIIDGDGGFVPVTLTAGALSKYGLIIIPQALYLAPSQKEAIETYVGGGGTVLLADPEVFGIVEQGPEVIKGDGKFVMLPRVEVTGHGALDLAEAYFYAYDDAMRRQIADSVNQHSERVIEVGDAAPLVCAYPSFQHEKHRILVHLINFDYISEEDQMRPKANITVRVKRPSFYEAGREARVYSPDFSADAPVLTLTPELKGKFIEVTLPKLDVYSVIVF